MTRERLVGSLAVALALTLCSGLTFAATGSGGSRTFTKSVDKVATLWGDAVTYSYTVSNTNGKTLYNIEVTDDGGTPDDACDDFFVGALDRLLPGQSHTFTVTKRLSPLLAPIKHEDPIFPGSLDVQVQANGDVIFTYTQSRSIVDNTYGANAVGYKHFFHHLVNSDNAEFSLTNANGDEVMYLVVDYLSQSDAYPSGYGTLGVSGRDGSIPLGDPAHVLYVTTAMTENLNQSPHYAQYTVDSPPEPDPNWDYFSRYTVRVDAAAFGPSGFGNVYVETQHNSPAKNDIETIEPEPWETCITNTAVVTADAYVDGVLQPYWTASSEATICVLLEATLSDISGTAIGNFGAFGTQPIYNATIELRRPDGTLLKTVQTDVEGKYVFKSVPGGDYNIFAPLNVKLGPKFYAYVTEPPNYATSLVDTDVTGLNFSYSLVDTNVTYSLPRVDG